MTTTPLNNDPSKPPPTPTWLSSAAACSLLSRSPRSLQRLRESLPIAHRWAKNKSNNVVAEYLLSDIERSRILLSKKHKITPATSQKHPPMLIDRRAAAAILQIDIDYLDHWIDKDYIRTSRHNGKIYLLQGDILQLACQ